jgi:hypothetical protein
MRGIVIFKKLQQETRFMLIYCAWCGRYQGATPAQGHQLRLNCCDIDTSGICPTCLGRYLSGDSVDPSVDLAAAFPAQIFPPEH